MATVISITASTVKIDSFYKYLLAMLQSLKENSNINVPIIIHYDTMTEKQADNLQKVNGNITEFLKIPTHTYRHYKKNSGGWFVLEGWKPTVEYDRVIILDSDFICQGDLTELTEVNADIAMVKEKTGIYNAGLVVASHSLLQENWYQKMLTADVDSVSIGGNRDKFSKDQKLINAWLKDRITELNITYNWLVSEEQSIHAKMVHYIYKPLYETGLRQLNDINKNLAPLWFKYYNKAIEVLND